MILCPLADLLGRQVASDWASLALAHFFRRADIHIPTVCIGFGSFYWHIRHNQGNHSFAAIGTPVHARCWRLGNGNDAAAVS
jgi:hypothetical protein